MIKIVICDDEAAFCDLLQHETALLMERLSEPFVITVYHNGEELLESGTDFDILLLDIQMPGIDGFTLAETFNKQGREYALIFITALRENVYDAFALEAVDYLCKPLEKERLSKSLERAVRRIQKCRESCLVIQTLSWSKTIKTNQIFYCEVINRKIYLHTTTGVVDYYCKIEDLEKQLDKRFLRCHRSYLVNLDYVEEYVEGQILLENKETVPVSRLRRQSFMEAMLQHLKKEMV